MFRVLIYLLLLVPLTLAAEIAGLPFENEQQEQRFRELSAELRCLVCQNQSLADSNASLAQDLRQELYEQVLENQSNTEIIDFMTQRYGEFILYKPRMNMKTVVLWFAPFVLLLAAFFFMVRFSKSQKPADDFNINDEERQKVRTLLQQVEPENNNDV